MLGSRYVTVFRRSRRVERGVEFPARTHGRLVASDDIEAVLRVVQPKPFEVHGVAKSLHGYQLLRALFFFGNTPVFIRQGLGHNGGGGNQRTKYGEPRGDTFHNSKSSKTIYLGVTNHTFGEWSRILNVQVLV